MEVYFLFSFTECIFPRSWIFYNPKGNSKWVGPACFYSTTCLRLLARWFVWQADWLPSHNLTKIGRQWRPILLSFIKMEESPGTNDVIYIMAKEIKKHNLEPKRCRLQTKRLPGIYVSIPFILLVGKFETVFICFETGGEIRDRFKRQSRICPPS